MLSQEDDLLVTAYFSVPNNKRTNLVISVIRVGGASAISGEDMVERQYKYWKFKETRKFYLKVLIFINCLY